MHSTPCSEKNGLFLFVIGLFAFFQHNNNYCCIKPYVPRELRRDPNNRRTWDMYPTLPGLELATCVFNTIFVSNHMYPENPEGTQAIVGSMNMGYRSDTTKNQTNNLFRPKCAPIPLDQRIIHSTETNVIVPWHILKKLRNQELKLHPPRLPKKHK